MITPTSDAGATAKLVANYKEWQLHPHFYVPTTPYKGCATCGYGPGAYFHNEFHVRRTQQEAQ
jgi:hypothetical protein